MSFRFRKLIEHLKSSTSSIWSATLTSSYLDCWESRKSSDMLNEYGSSVFELPRLLFNRGCVKQELLRRVFDWIKDLDGNNGAGPLEFVLCMLQTNQRADYVTIQDGGCPKTFNFIAYYMFFANRIRYENNSRRIADLSENVQLSNSFQERMVSQGHPDYVRIMFQYGARLYNDDHSIHPNVKLLTHLILHFLSIGHVWNHWTKDMVLEIPVDDFHPHIKSMVAIVKIILRVIRKPQEITYLIAGQDCNFSYSIYSSGILGKIPEIAILLPLYDAIFPGLNFGRKEPSSLKHFCRFYIRHRLNENWGLPEGINRLEIPKTLKCYLNLFDD